MALQRRGLSRRDSMAPVPGCRIAAAAAWFLRICLIALPYIQPAHSQAECRSPDFYYDEMRNPLGPNRCASDCECDGMRLCALSGWCTGVARVVSPPPPPPPPSPVYYPTCQTISGYTLQVGVDYNGGPEVCERDMNLATAAANCSSDPACKAFSHLNANSSGFGLACRKRETGPTTARSETTGWSSSCFYVKIQQNAPPPPAQPVPRPAFSSLRNVALARPTYASSNAEVSYLAVDGDKSASGIFGTSNWDKSEHWLSVDLGASYTIYFIVLFARKDCCGEQLVNAEIRIGDTAITTEGNNLQANDLGERLNPYGGGLTGAVYNVSLDPPRTGRWVTVQNFNRNYSRAIDKSLMLLELEVYGTAANCSNVTSCPPTNTGGGGPKKRIEFMYIFIIPIILGGIAVISVVVIAVLLIVWLVRRRKQGSGTLIASSGGPQDAPPLNTTIAVVSSPQQPPAAGAPFAGVPMYGTPAVGPYSKEPAGGAMPTTFTAAAMFGGKSDQAAADDDKPEWLRKRLEQKQQQQQDAASGGSDAAPPPTPAIYVVTSSAPPPPETTANGSSSTPGLPVTVGTGNANTSAAAPNTAA
ncbi:hypothetical protein PLESTB_001522100 [Pleodorina starrii]|uniref:Fucolectin tachylectin-4 pentraxin-1 domain-containing protein n=1 Tax=Pleodorina starrii TaxID=330485 RepID=A0A9W6F7Z5_9CHLO|nr:hypothetical protein PLESTM_001868100 [Pleodorina starrii]GLC59684.1 hypothetical protein PLESTB_001522100 [Pleodorina starrii]GLC74648.1 hypothetical protein PLESTF_001539300 [Pleodorina starrii]